MLIAELIGIAALAIVVASIKRGLMSKKAGRIYTIGIVIFLALAATADVFYIQHIINGTAWISNTGSQYPFNYFFPEITLAGKIYGVLLGITIDVVAGIILLVASGNSNLVDGAIISIPAGIYFVKTYILFLMHTANQPFRFGTALSAMFAISLIIVLPAYFIVDWVNEFFAIN